MPIVFRGALVGELAADGDVDLGLLERVATLISAYVLVGWDTGGRRLGALRLQGRPSIEGSTSRTRGVTRTRDCIPHRRHYKEKWGEGIASTARSPSPAGDADLVERMAPP